MPMVIQPLVRRWANVLMSACPNIGPTLANSKNSISVIIQLPKIWLACQPLTNIGPMLEWCWYMSPTLARCWGRWTLVRWPNVAPMVGRWLAQHWPIVGPTLVCLWGGTSSWVTSSTGTSWLTSSLGTTSFSTSSSIASPPASAASSGEHARGSANMLRVGDLGIASPGPSDNKKNKSFFFLAPRHFKRWHISMYPTPFLHPPFLLPRACIIFWKSLNLSFHIVVKIRNSPSCLHTVIFISSCSSSSEFY